MAWEENSRICLHMQLIAILSRIGVENWYQYAKNSPGEHYATTSSSYRNMFETKHNLEDDKLYYEIYDSEGNLTLVTNDDKKARNVIR